MSQTSTKYKFRHWSFVGYDLSATDPKLLELLEVCGCVADVRDYRGRSAIFVDCSRDVEFIRENLWGHPWAIHSDWLKEFWKFKGEGSNATI